MSCGSAIARTAAVVSFLSPKATQLAISLDFKTGELKHGLVFHWEDFL